jgi:hypothetical protein
LIESATAVIDADPRPSFFRRFDDLTEQEAIAEFRKLYRIQFVSDEAMLTSGLLRLALEGSRRRPPLDAWFRQWRDTHDGHVSGDAGFDWEFFPSGRLALRCPCGAARELVDVAEADVRRIFLAPETT